MISREVDVYPDLDGEVLMDGAGGPVSVGSSRWHFLVHGILKENAKVD